MEKVKNSRQDFAGILSRIWQNFNYVVIFAAIFVVYLIINGRATNWMAITNIMRHSSVIGITALAMGLVILIGDIDLSVGSSVALVGGFSVLVFNGTGSMTLTILSGMAGGALAGLANGLLTGKVRMPSFIATLATMMMYRSISQFYLSKTGVAMYKINAESSQYKAFFALGNGNLFTIPILTIIFFSLAAILIYVTSSTKFGKTIYAVGSNDKAARLAGVNVEGVRILVYVVSGVLVGIAAVLFAAQNGTVTPSTAGKNYELYAIAATVIGGVSMNGGKGKILGIVFGMLTFNVIDKIILSLGLNPLINDTIKGAILLIAIILQLLKKKR